MNFIVLQQQHRRYKIEIQPKTNRIILVSPFSQCADLDEIGTTARPHRLWVIEDAAQSYGAPYKGRLSGSLMDVAATPFSPRQTRSAVVTV